MEFQEEIQSVSTGFAEIFSKAASGQNIQRLRIAEGNIRAATDTIELEKTVGRRDVARALARHTGQVEAQIAFSGGGVAGTGLALIDSAGAQAADQAAVIEANAGAKEAAVIFANQPILEDPILAAIQGLETGLTVSTNIVRSLIEEADVFNFSSPAGFRSFLDVPGFDLDAIIERLRNQ